MPSKCFVIYVLIIFCASNTLLDLLDSNACLYYCMIIGFFTHETFKEDVLSEVLPVTSYPSTVRRKVLDIAAKFVKAGGQIIMRVSTGVMHRLKFALLWAKCQCAPSIQLT